MVTQRAPDAANKVNTQQGCKRTIFSSIDRPAFEASWVSCEVTPKPEFSLAGEQASWLVGEPTSLPARGNLPAAPYKLAMGQVCLQGQSPTVARPVHGCTHLSPNTLGGPKIFPAVGQFEHP